MPEELVDSLSYETLRKFAISRSGSVSIRFGLAAGGLGAVILVAKKLGIIGDVIAFAAAAGKAEDFREAGDVENSNRVWAEYLFEAAGGITGAALAAGVVQLGLRGRGGIPGIALTVLAGLAGGVAGSYVGSALGDYLYDKAPELFDPIINAIYERAEKVNSSLPDGADLTEAVVMAALDILGLNSSGNTGVDKGVWLTAVLWQHRVGGSGDDFLLGQDAETRKNGELLDPAKPNGDRAEQDLAMVLDGGEGNDWVIGIGGEGAKTIGGLGRDWIYNRTDGGVIYGDSETGTYEKPVIGADGRPVLNADGSPKTTPTKVEDSKENSDNIWYSPNTVMKDAQHHDVLKFYGLTLTGGDANGGLLSLLGQGVIGAGIGVGNFAASIDETGTYDWTRSLYFDHLMPWMTYRFQKNKSGNLDMLVTNQFDLVFNAVMSLVGGVSVSEAYKKQKDLDAKGILQGWMKIENVDVVGGYLGVQQAELAHRGTFNMVFKAVNPLSILAPLVEAFGAIGGLVSVMSMADNVLGLAAAAARALEGAKWSLGADPLVIDLDGDGIETQDLGANQVYFDVDGDVFAERTGWLSGDDGFLARDRNRDGRVDDISEMFGGPGRSGFGDLRALDSNGDGKITRADLLWAELKVWQDKNSDGVTDAGEVKTLDELGIVTLDLGATAINITTPQGARLTAFGDATFADGTRPRVYDAVLSANDADTRYVGEAGRAAWQGTGQGASLDLKGFGRIANLSIAMANDLDFAALAPRRATAMTTPDLRVLTAQVGEVLGAWGFTLEQTRELTPDIDNAGESLQVNV